MERATARDDGSDPTEEARGTNRDVERATARDDGNDPTARDVTIRPAGPGDAEATRAIYDREVAESTATFDLVPRTVEEQRTWLAAHSGGHLAVVALDGSGEVVGFGSLSPFRSRPAYSTTVEDSVYVRRDCHGAGVGRALLEELIARATAHGFHSMIARIVGGHDASIALHRACGFVVIGTEREVGRKFSRWLDVVQMQRML